MGAVYLAEDQRLPTKWAIKEMKHEGRSPEELEEAAELFRTEARLLSELRHRNLPRIVDFFQIQEQLYLVMDFVEGRTLEDMLLKDGPLSPNFALDLSLQISDVLDYLHTRKPPVVFRDFKPGNVMLTPQNEVKLIDFGIARTFQEDKAKDTRALGTPGYAAPEQYGKGQSDPRTDLYAFGATMHHALSGRDPTDEPFVFPSLRNFRQDLPEDFVQLLESCLALAPKDRPDSAFNVKRTLEQMMGAGAAPRPTTARLDGDDAPATPVPQAIAPGTRPLASSEGAGPSASESPPAVPTPTPAPAPPIPAPTGPMTGSMTGPMTSVAVFSPKAISIKELNPGGKATARFRVRASQPVTLISNSPNVTIEPQQVGPGKHQIVMTVDSQGLEPGSTLRASVELEEVDDIELAVEAKVAQPRASIGILVAAFTLCFCTLLPIVNFFSTAILGVLVFSTSREKRSSLKIPWRLSIFFTLGWTALLAAIGFGLAQLDWATYLEQIKGWF